MLMQNFGVTNKEHYGTLRYFLDWSIAGWGEAEHPTSHNGSKIYEMCSGEFQKKFKL